VPYSWVRTVQGELTFESGTSLIASIPRGDTLRALRFGWGFYGVAQQTADIGGVLATIQVFGLVTTVGNGSESVPNPRTDPGNADPPTERWLWWEARSPQIMSYSDAADAVWFRDTPRGEPTLVQSMVSAKTIAEGDTLNLWASWAAASGWDATGFADMWYWASVGYEPSS
jgi:hypothetical protein